jgi:hypothetical protein
MKEKRGEAEGFASNRVRGSAFLLQSRSRLALRGETFHGVLVTERKPEAQAEEEARAHGERDEEPRQPIS